MTWVAWRTQRLEILVSVGVVAIFAIWLLITGIHEHSVWSSYLSHGCLARSGPICSALQAHWSSASRWNGVDIEILYFIPGFVGLSIGAPMVAKEIATGTNRFAWTQSVSRMRWLSAKLAIGMIAAVAISDALALIVQWWSSAGYSGMRIQPKLFGATGIVLVAYTVFAFMLGAALGAALRKTGWAFGIGAVIFAGFRILIQSVVRPNLIHPSAIVANSYNQSLISNGWVLGSGYLPLDSLFPSSRQPWIYSSAGINRCNGLESHFHSSLHELDNCLRLANVHYVVNLFVESDYGKLQLLESGIFILGAVILMSAMIFAVRRWQS